LSSAVEIVRATG